MKTAYYVISGALVLATGIMIFDNYDGLLEMVVGTIGVIVGTGMITYGTSRSE